MDDAASTPIDCPNCHARTLDLGTGVKMRGALTAVLIPPTYTCGQCGAVWMLGEANEPGAVAVAEGYILVRIQDR